MSNTLRVEKIISTLPSQLQPNTMYLVRSGEGIDIYVSDSTGSIAHKHNSPIGGGSDGPMDTDINYWDIIGEFTPAQPSFNINGNTLIEGDNIKGVVQLPIDNILSTDKKHNYRNTSLKFSISCNPDDVAEISFSDIKPLNSSGEQTMYLYIVLLSYPGEMTVGVGYNYATTIYKQSNDEYEILLDIDQDGNITLNGSAVPDVNIPDESVYLNFTKVDGYSQGNTFSYDFTDVITLDEGPIALPTKTNSFYICNNNRIYNNVSYRKNDLLLVKDSPDDITIINSIPAVYDNVIGISDNSKIIEPIYPNPSTAPLLEKIVDTNNEYMLTPIYGTATLLYKNITIGVFRISLSELVNVGDEIRIVLSPASYEINPNDPMYNVFNITNGVYVTLKKYENYILVDVMGQSFKTTLDYIEVIVSSYSISVYSITHYIYYKDIFNAYYIYIDGSYTNKPITLNNSCTTNIAILNKSSARPGDILLSNNNYGLYNDTPIYINSKYLLLENNKLELIFGGPDNNRPPHGMFKGIISESSNFYQPYKAGDMFIYKKDDESYNIGFTDKDNNLYTVQAAGDQKPYAAGIAYGDFSNNNNQLLNIDSKTLLSDMLATLLANVNFNMIDDYYHSVFTVDVAGKTEVIKIKDKPSPLVSIYYTGYSDKRDTNIIVNWDKPCYYLNPTIQDIYSRFIIDANQYLNYETVVEVNDLSNTFGAVPSHSIIIGLFSSEQTAITANPYIYSNRHNNFLGIEIKANSYRIQLVDYDEFEPYIDLPVDSVLNIKMVYNNAANTLVINITDDIIVELPVINLSWKSDFHPYLSVNAAGSQESYTYNLKIKGKSLDTNNGSDNSDEINAIKNDIIAINNKFTSPEQQLFITNIVNETIDPILGDIDLLLTQILGT